MNVASLELCKELYELSGWDDLDLSFQPERGNCPRYDLGYLLRKLPNSTDIDAEEFEEAFDCSAPESFFLAWEMDTLQHEWRVQFQIEDSVLENTMFEADTPEDALCLLIIELFKQGILTPSSNKKEKES